MSDRDIKKAREQDEHFDHDKAMQVAFKRFINDIAGTNDDPDVGPIEASYLALEELERLETVEQELAGARQEISELEGVVESLRDIGNEKTTKEEKIAAIVSYADNIRDDGQAEITVAAQEIKGAAGVSRRYAYDLIEDVAEQHGWASVREPKSQPSGKDGGRMIEWKKALAVDFEQLHEDPESVNKFTTEVAG